MFLFVEVACLGHGAAACRRLRGCLWEDVAFWKAYAGVCLARQPVRDGPAKLRERFRVWLFHLEGHWAMDFANAAAQDRQAEFGANFLQLFSDARYIASGLMPWDKGPEVDAFAQVACSLLSQYNPKQLDERWAAESLISKVEQRCDVFMEDQVERVTQAFEESLEKSMLEQHLQGAEDASLTEPLPEGAWQTWDLEEESEEDFPGMDDFAWPSPTQSDTDRSDH
ncbi:unnamed protein product [Effrenium voratum]|nr:unnamed protein product [Effrenium voratum]